VTSLEALPRRPPPSEASSPRFVVTGAPQTAVFGSTERVVMASRAGALADAPM